MTTREVEVAIVGAGTAGLAAYRAAREHTDRLALIEGGPYGTTCARVGCMPSKLLIAAADAAHGAREADVFGVQAGAPRIDGRRVMARLHEHRDRFVGHVIKAVERFPEAHRLRGHARFEDPHTLAVGEDLVVRAERIVIATGSEPHIPDNLERAGARLITSDDLFAMADLPASVAVFGAGVVGLELAQALQRLGVRTHLFSVGGAVGPLSDPRVVDYACRTFAAAYAFDPDADVREVRDEGAAVAVRFAANGGAEQTLHFERLLAATGRKPQLQGLALERAGIELDEQGVPSFERTTGQCGDSHIFIAGDADATLALLHEAADDGRIAGDNAGRFPDVRVRRRRAPLTVLYTRPEVALVGQSFKDLEAAGAPFETGEVCFEDQGRATVINRAQGLLRVYGERGSGRFLGAEMIAPGGEHLAHLLAWALQRQLTVQEILDLPYYHPTLEEGIRTAVRQLRHNLRMGPPPTDRCIDCGPGG